MLFFNQFLVDLSGRKTLKTHATAPLSKAERGKSKLRRAIDTYIAELFDLPESVGRFPMHEKH